MKKYRSTLLDIALNIIVPYAIYKVAKQYFSASEITALVLSSLYPLFDIVREYLKDRTLNFISVIVIMGTFTGILGALMGGNPRIILIRESFFTVILSIACFISLFTKRTLIFYFAREFSAGKDPVKRKNFEDILKYPPVQKFFRLLTIIWGVVYLSEFILKVLLVYSFPTSTVLLLSPIFTYTVTGVTLAWTFWYGKRLRERNEKPRKR